MDVRRNLGRVRVSRNLYNKIGTIDAGVNPRNKETEGASYSDHKNSISNIDEFEQVVISL